MRAPGETRPAPFLLPGRQLRSPLAGSGVCGERRAPRSARTSGRRPWGTRVAQNRAGPALPSPAGGSRRRAPPVAAKTGTPVPSRPAAEPPEGPVSGCRWGLQGGFQLGITCGLRSGVPRPLRRCAAGLPDMQVLSAPRPRHLGAAPMALRGVPGRDRVPPSRGSPGGGGCPRDARCPPLLPVPPQHPAAHPLAAAAPRPRRGSEKVDGRERGCGALKRDRER